MPITASDFMAPANQPFTLAERPTSVSLFTSKKAAKAVVSENAKIIKDLSYRLYAEKDQSFLIVLQGMDTSGKDSTTKALFHLTPPLNVKVAPFIAPSAKERAHDYLWRVHQVCPGVGEITVFNRSHYEDVLVVKVRQFAPADKIEQRYDQINQFEKHLSENGTTILKFMLNISYETQGQRLHERLIKPHKLWKFNPNDIKDRALWPDFMSAYEIMVNRTSTSYAPWHIIPSDSRSTRNAIISQIVRDKLEALNPQYPNPGYDSDDFEIG